MAKQVFFTINGDTGQAVKSIKELEEEIKRLRTEWKNTEDPIARNQIAESLKGAKTELNNFNSSLKDGQTLSGKISSGISSAFAQIGTAVGGLFVADKIISFGQESVAAFKEAELSARALSAAVGDVEQDFVRLNTQAEELEQTSIFTAEDVQAIQTAALQFGLTVDEVEKLTPVVTDLASATGQDLNSAFNQVLGGLKGQQKALSDYRVEVDSSATVQERLTSITDQLNSKFKGQGQAVLDAQGGFAKLGKEVGILQEEIGGNLVQALDTIKPAVEGIVTGFLTLVKVLTSIPTFLAENKGAFVALTGAIIGLNAQQIIAQGLAIKTAAAQKLQQAQTFATTVATKGLNAAFKANPIGLVITLVTALVGAFITLYENSQTVRAGIAGLFKAVKTAFVGIKDLAVAYLTGVGDLILGIFTFDLDKIKAGADRLINGFKTYGSNVAASFQEGFKDKVDEENAKGQNQPKVKVGVQGPDKKEVKNTRDNIKKQLEDIDIKLSSVEIGSEAEAKLLKQKKDLQDKLDAADGKNKDKSSKDNKERAERDAKLDEDIETQKWKNKSDAAITASQKTSVELEKLTQERTKLQQQLDEEEKKQGADRNQKYIDLLKSQIEGADINIGVKTGELEKQIKDETTSANNAVIEGITKTNSDILTINKNNAEAEISILETKLQTVKKGSLEELKIKQQIALQKKNIEISETQSAIKNFQDRIDKGISLNSVEESEFRKLKEKLVQINGEKNELINSQDEQQRQQRIANFQAQAEEFLQFAAPAAQAISDLINFSNEREQERIQKSIEANEQLKEIRLTQLDEEYERQKQLYGASETLEKNYLNKKKKIEAEAEAQRAKLQLEAWKKDKQAKLKTAIINTAVAIGNALATTQPFTPNALIAAGVAAFQGGLQVAAIAAEDPPQFQKGGILRGKSHSQGGIPLMNSGGRVIAEAEGGEIILNKNVSKNPRLTAIASAINQQTGGVSFSSYDPIASSIVRNSFERGGIVQRVPRFVDGGIVEQISNQQFGDLNETLLRINNRLSEPSRAYVIEQDVTTSQNLNSLIERRAKLS